MILGTTVLAVKAVMARIQRLRHHLKSRSLLRRDAGVIVRRIADEALPAANRRKVRGSSKSSFSTCSPRIYTPHHVRPFISASDPTMSTSIKISPIAR